MTTTTPPEPVAWQNRIVGYRDLDVAAIIENPRNWRAHPPAQLDALGGALREIGIVQNVIVNTTTGRMVDGHARVLLARRDGQPRVPATLVELSEAEEALVLATLDPIGTLAGTQEAIYRDLLAGLSARDDDLATFLADQRDTLLDPLPVPDSATDAHYAVNEREERLAEGSIAYNSLRALQALVAPAVYDELLAVLKLLGKKWGTTTVTDTLVKVIRDAGATLTEPD